MQDLSSEKGSVSTLIEITKQLTSIINEELNCLKTSRPAEIINFQDRKSILTASYNKELNNIKLNGGLSAAGNGEAIRSLKKESREFQTVLEKHSRIIKAKKNLSERMVQEITNEVANQNGANNKYGPNAKMTETSFKYNTPSLAVNRTI